MLNISLETLGKKRIFVFLLLIATFMNHTLKENVIKNLRERETRV